jgi:hypothetical protein
MVPGGSVANRALFDEMTALIDFSERRRLWRTLYLASFCKVTGWNQRRERRPIVEFLGTFELDLFPFSQLLVCHPNCCIQKQFAMASTTNLFDRGPDHIPLQASSKRTDTRDTSIAFGVKTERSPLGVDFQPSDLSVICGRGRYRNHLGNQRFRILVSTFVEEYSQADSKTIKSALVFKIVTMIRQAGGHFCKLEKGVWFEVGDRIAREKVSAFFRDMLHTQYRSSSKAKVTLRRARNRKNREMQQHGQGQLVEGTGDRDDSSRSSSCSRSSKDSLGFDSAMEIGFFDIDVFAN